MLGPLEAKGLTRKPIPGMPAKRIIDRTEKRFSRPIQPVICRLEERCLPGLIRSGKGSPEGWSDGPKREGVRKGVPDCPVRS